MFTLAFIGLAWPFMENQTFGQNSWRFGSNAGSNSGHGSGRQRALKQLTNDLAIAVASGGLTSAQADTLAQHVATFLKANQQNQQAALTTLQADVQALLTSTTVNVQIAQALAADITAVVVQATLQGSEGMGRSRGNR
jgi:hypothetical protein